MSVVKFVVKLAYFSATHHLATDLSYFIRQHRFLLTFGKAETNNLQQFCALIRVL